MIKTILASAIALLTLSIGGLAVTSPANAGAVCDELCQIYAKADKEPSQVSLMGIKTQQDDVVLVASTCVREATGACIAANKAATRPAYNGAVAPTTGPMACLYVLIPTAETEIVLLAGARLNQSPVLTYIGANSGHVVSDGSRGISLKEFCFPRGLIAGLKAITICSGHTPGVGNHHTLRDPYLSALQTYGHAGDYLSLLGVAGTEAGDILTTYDEDLYTQQYGFNLR